MPPANGLRVTALLTALVALGPISTDLYLPSLPGLLRHFGADIAEVQLTLSVFLLGLAGGQLVYGPLSDRFGRRPVLLTGLVIYVLASLACVAASGISALIAARFLQACGACAGPVVCRAVVRDVHGREGAARVLSYMGAAMAIAPALGPILGGFIEGWLGWRANFAVLALYGAVGPGVTVAILPETAPDRDQPIAVGSLLYGYGALLKARAYMGFVLASPMAASFPSSPAPPSSSSTFWLSSLRSMASASPPSCSATCRARLPAAG
jgi:MFS transporter, DHA1 family, multidrug resistance protein